MGAVICPGAGAVERIVVIAAQTLATRRIPPDPVAESVFYGALLLLGDGGLLAVEHPLLIAVFIFDKIKDAHVLQVQRLLDNAVGVNPIGAEGHVRPHIIAAVG